jgi:DMSO/TMAO reductase YedYZ molybdopterin-dependent catalytic subunit
MHDDREHSSTARPERRAFLRGAAALAVSYWAGGGLPGRAEQSQGKSAGPAGGLIVRQRQPDNLESPFEVLDAFLVPNERFYVRNHFAAPKIDARAWRLRVEGAVEKPLEIGYDELLKLPSHSQVALLECAGNGRVFLTPKARGVGWGFGAVGTAEWTGVPLAEMLERAGVRSSAVEVVLEGADSGSVEEEPKSPGAIHFARSLPLAKARKPEVLLAYRMNGKELPAAHGYPLRAVVAGWYGMASVKWLTRVVVVDRPFQGYFQTFDYTYFERRDGLPVITPITELEVKASIARPALQEVVPADQPYRVHGAAWSGEADVTQVEVSTDNGRNWSKAQLLDKPAKYAWRFWEYRWQTPSQPGPQVLMARATDSRGRTQPAQRDPDRRNYMISHVLPVEVEVR